MSKKNLSTIDINDLDFLGLNLSKRTLFFEDNAAADFLCLTIKTEAEAHAWLNRPSYDGPPSGVLSAEATASQMAALRRAYAKRLPYDIEYICPNSPETSASASVKVYNFGSMTIYPGDTIVLDLLDGSSEPPLPYGGLDEESLAPLDGQPGGRV